MIPSELLKEIKYLELKAGFIANEVLAGEYLSAFKGQGMEFSEVREYMFGDDVQNIDWNITAKMNYPHVKIFQEERELTLMLMIDGSASQQFGSVAKVKQRVTAELAAILAFLAIRNNDKVGLLIFSDGIDHYIPPQKGRGHVWHIIQTILSPAKIRGRNTKLPLALEFLLTVSKRQQMCFLLSDFVDVDLTTKALAIVARRHDLICVQVQDQRERQLPACGLLDLVDSESGQVVTVDTSNRQFRQQLQQRIVGHQRQLEKIWRQQGIDNFQIDTASSITRPLVNFLHRRSRYRR